MPKKTVIHEEITPAHLRCVPANCPAVFMLSDGNLLIIGKKLSKDIYTQVEGKISDDELAITLSPEFFRDLPAFS